MVSIRATILLAITAAMSARAYSYDDAIEALVARAYADEYDSLVAREYAPSSNRYIARAYSDDGMGVMARDLAELGIRSEDISHVLVLRGSGSRSPSPVGLTKAECENYIRTRKQWIAEITPKIRAKSSEIKKEKDAAKKLKLQRELSQLNGLHEQYIEDLEGYEKILPTLKK